MSEQTVERGIPLWKDAPKKCTGCPYLDVEHDPFFGASRFYCKAPWWDKRRWFCALPAEVVRA
jgi:hypothetical protein